MNTAESTQPNVAILGAGVMGETLLSGLVRSGWDAARIVVSERKPGAAQHIRDRYSVTVTDNQTACRTADVVVLAVKPQDIEDLVRVIRADLCDGALVLSLAAGITTTTLESWLPANQAVVRAMPNTPSLVDQGMAAISAGSHCEAAHLDQAEELLSRIGKVVRIAEKHQDAVTAISGSGPAYIFYVVEAMIEAGVLLGLPRGTSTDLVVQTLYGAASMLKETGEHPTVLREQVSSPAGTTMAALRQLDDHKVRAAFLTAMEAARDRSCELSGS